MKSAGGNVQLLSFINAIRVLEMVGWGCWFWFHSSSSSFACFTKGLVWPVSKNYVWWMYGFCDRWKINCIKVQLLPHENRVKKLQCIELLSELYDDCFNRIFFSMKSTRDQLYFLIKINIAIPLLRILKHKLCIC